MQVLKIICYTAVCISGRLYPVVLTLENTGTVRLHRITIDRSGRVEVHVSESYVSNLTDYEGNVFRTFSGPVKILDIPGLRTACRAVTAVLLRDGLWYDIVVLFKCKHISKVPAISLITGRRYEMEKLVRAKKEGKLVKLFSECDSQGADYPRVVMTPEKTPLYYPLLEYCPNPEDLLKQLVPSQA